jgi:hypothetical protein
MRKLLVVGVIALMSALVPVAPAAAACSTDWGSVKETSDAHPDSPIVDVRVGDHGCYDRLVVELDGAAPGYVVKYVRHFVPSADGKEHNLRGAATLQVTMLGARAHDDEGNPTYTPAHRRNMFNVDDFQTFRQVYWGGTFEGTTVIGLGVRARLPFRVQALDGPDDHTRLVIDVAHSW